MMGTSHREKAGTRIGDYAVEHELPAKPGLIAFSATHALLPRRARLLVLHPAFVSIQSMAMPLIREACILETLRHPGVPRVFECGILPDRRPWFASELIEGPTISAVVAKQGPLSVPAVISLLADVAEILHHAHARGLVHRNLRPEIIATRREGPCILDWADARGSGPDPVPPVPTDSVNYLPPEVVHGEPADSRADVFALGVIAFEALAGSRRGSTAARRFPGAAPRLTALLDRMLAADPLVRPTAAEVRAEALAVFEHIDVPPAEDDAADVHVVDVELDAGAGTEGDGDGDGEAEAEPELELELEPVEPHDAKLRWTPVDALQRTKTETIPPTTAAALELSRTLTQPMEASDLELAARTATESMQLDPEPGRPPLTRMALPTRVLERTRRKSP